MNRKTAGRKRPKRYSKRLESELTSLEREFLSTLRQRLKKARSVSAHDPTEFMDIAADSEMDDLAARLAESDSTKIDEIEEALQRLHEGNYGVCRGCGEAISKRRLQVRPFATLCVKCKQEQERSGVSPASEAGPANAEGASADVGGREAEDEDHPAMEELFHDMETSELF